MAEYELFDRVRLKDGSVGTIIEVYTNPPGYEIDSMYFDTPTQSIAVYPDEILEKVPPGTKWKPDGYGE